MIVETYRQKLEDLKPTFFRKWLAKEIGMPEEKINLSSLNSALVRQRKRDEKNKLKGRNNSSAANAKNNADQTNNFIFSSAENVTSKKRTTEL